VNDNADAELYDLLAAYNNDNHWKDGFKEVE
jgi:hypothetical protein